MEELFSENNYPLKIHYRRDIRAGHLRGAHLEFIFREVICRMSGDPVWQRARALVKERRTLVYGPKLVNIYLIPRYALSHESNEIECGSYRGRSALFMASVQRRLFEFGSILCAPFLYICSIIG